MTDREKLVGLVKEICNTVVKACGCSDMLPTYSFCKNAVYESIADYLITNGVTMWEWISVEDRRPESGKHVLLCCEVKRLDGSVGSRYVCDGYYAAKHTEIASSCGDDIAYEYSEEDDEYYLCEGWYEVIKNWDDYNSVVIDDFVVGWQPLPEPQKEEPQ